MAKVDVNANGLKPFYSFDQLVIGPNNQVAAAACRAVVEAPGEAYNPLFIYGSSGVGKTHLMQATAHEMLRANPKCRVKYISAERFISEMVNSISEDRVMEVRGGYSQLDLLIIDDVQYLIESKVSQEELFHIFNNMHHENHQLILAADRPPNQLVNLNKNIRSRLEWGLASDIKVPDLATRVEILKKKQQNQNLSMNNEMLQFVAERLRSNVRELEGFLKRIHAYTTLSHQEINIDLVKSVVRELMPDSDSALESREAEIPPAPPPPPPSAAARSVAAPANGHAVEAPLPPAPPPPKPSFDPPKAVSAAQPKEAAPPELSPFGEIEFNPAAPPPAPATPKKITAPPPVEKAAPPPPVPPPVEKPRPAPVAIPIPVEPAPEESAGGDDEDLPNGHKEVGAVFFFPIGGEQALETVHQKFQEVIKKHKLKFRLKRVHNEKYEIKGKVNYSAFVDVCKANKVPVAIVIGPSPEMFIPEQDFYDLLTVTLDVQGVSLQLVNWAEINKDYRYLNLALDIALVRSR